MNLRLMHDGQFIRIGEYTITPRRKGILKDTLWIEHKSGEGMERSIDDLEEYLEAALEDYFSENM